MTTNQIDPVSGELHWPTGLQDSRFGDVRTAIGDLAANWVRYGELTGDDQALMRANIGILYQGLKSQIGYLPPQEYVASRNFLDSLLYATTRAVL